MSSRNSISVEPPWIHTGSTMAYKAALPDPFMKFLFRNLKTTKETWPLATFLGIWAVGCMATIYWSLTKPEIGLNRSGKHTQYDWERMNEAFGKQWFLKGKGPISEYKKRIPELDEVQAEMMKAKASSE